MGTVIKVSGLDASHRRFFLGSPILSTVSSYPRLIIEIHCSFEYRSLFK